MISDPFNAVGGLTVGIPPLPIADANGNIVTNVNFPAGNVSANRFFANQYFFGNGAPFSTTPAGTSTQIQFNQSGTLGASPDLTFDFNNSIFTTTNLNITQTANLGSVGNITITGGSFGYYLQTDGTGNLQWAPGGGGNGGGNTNPGGSNTYIQYNSAGTFGGSPSFTFNAATGVVTAPNLTVTGTLSASIPGSDIVGAVQYATVANSVYGGNVSGAVAYATIANGVAGSNVFGAVNYATTANSVAGANVVGAVQYATVANSVTGSNVFGQVAFAAIANSVAGANVTGAVHYAAIANSVAGANVTGQVSYAAVANSVAGANVTDQVAYAAIANSVAGPNVVGPVNSLNAAITDVSISGGVNGYVLQTDGAGNLSWTAQTGGGGGNGTPGGANTDIQFNNAGTFGGASGFTFNNVTNLMTVGNANITSNLTATNANITTLLKATTANVVTLNASSSIAAVNISGRLTTNSQPNITSVGTLTSLNVDGLTNLGPVGNVSISGGTLGYVLSTDGAGSLSWIQASGTPGGTNQQLQFNNSGSFAGVPTATWDGSLLSLGDVTQVSIGGGTSGYFLQTDGGGGLSWAAANGGGGIPGGTNTQVQYNNAGNFGGSTGFTFNSATAMLTAPNLTVTGSTTTNGSANVTGNTRTSNLTVTQKTNLGSVSNVTITGGTSGQYLQTNGSGVLTWANVTGGNGSPGGTDTQLQFNNAGTFGGIPTVSWDGSLLTLGDVANISIGGGQPGYALSTDGAGVLSWIQTSGSPGGSNNQIQYNHQGTFAGNTDFTYNPVTGVVNLVGSMVANSLTLGTGLNQFWTANVFGATTAGAGQAQLLAISTVNLSAIEFTIIATDSVVGNRQITKSTAVYYQGNVNYNDYSQIYAGGPVASYSIAYNAGYVVLYVTPENSNPITYRMQITQYAA